MFVMNRPFETDWSYALFTKQYLVQKVRLLLRARIYSIFYYENLEEVDKIALLYILSRIKARQDFPSYLF